jgi:1,4-dihydroxy-2-naphthoyl-CoA hydrolase
MDFAGTMMEALDMKAVELTPDRVVFSMPVGPKTRQPMGFLHGGASVALAETAASIGTSLHIDKETETAVGMEINANHIRVKGEGMVTAIAVPIHKGRTSMVWDIKIVDEKDKLICVSRCTMAIIKQR